MLDVTPLLSVDQLSTHYHTRRGVLRAVDRVSFDIRRGETVAIVGESGSGKSVTALSILRLVPNPPGRIVGGRVMFEGQDLLALSDADMEHLRGNRIGMIFQEPMTSLNPTLTIGTQLTEGMVHHLRLTQSQADKRAAELLQSVGIAEPVGRLRQYPHQFSGGMRQRIMIAIALACDPALIIADEPTTALDVTIQAQILSVLKRLASENGTSVMMITHDLGVVARIADRVNVMYAGRLVEKGTARELYADPRHPYTRGLLASVPRMDAAEAERLTPIEGSPPDPARLPSGCAFHPRCPLAIDRCAADQPPLAPGGGAHSAACWVTMPEATAAVLEGQS
ncbi:ABC transporter ATP-binding protein [Aquibium sp. A9E412]|uniref:ABC transporter ATP-binding protein n=1 Tax=Aquibium sp. A9E412 TaxID=2976767 RepID=UPI0025B18EB6|nr:ABC transporter ATP-binding protein [Aquibium sp. A9E412]MDN2566927.1 ABC transporter ATP-binding protein [Aquibium sp. A9E412]